MKQQKGNKMTDKKKISGKTLDIVAAYYGIRRSMFGAEPDWMVRYRMHRAMGLSWDTSNCILFVNSALISASISAIILSLIFF